MKQKTPHYIVKKVGDKFVPVLSEAGSESNTLCLLGGGVLFGLGLRRRNLFGSLAMLIGTGFTYHALTGKNPLDEILCRNRAARQSRGPSFARDNFRPTDQKPEDEVDEAAMESFPASDPPAHSKSSSAVKS
jgi:hypothetical protein